MYTGYLNYTNSISKPALCQPRENVSSQKCLLIKHLGIKFYKKNNEVNYILSVHILLGILDKFDTSKLIK